MVIFEDRAFDNNAARRVENESVEPSSGCGSLAAPHTAFLRRSAESKICLAY
jgi:hypothetical protein